MEKNLGMKVLFLLVIMLIVLFCFAPGIVLTACPDMTIFWKVIMTVWAVPAVALCLCYYRLLAKTPAKEYSIDPLALDLSFLDDEVKSVRIQGTFETKAVVMILLSIAVGFVIGFDLIGVFHTWKLNEPYVVILTAALLSLMWVLPAPKKIETDPQTEE